MTAEKHHELERSYEVSRETVLPSLTGVVDGWVMGQAAEIELDAVYVDTTDLALAGRGVTLRRRTGGDDAGWHLKLPRSADLREERRWPVGEDPDEVPDEALASVRAWVRDRTVSPLAAIRTRRLERTITDAEGVHVATLCDDEVRAERLVGARQELAWREWEVEVVDGHGPDVLDLVGERLVEAGAEPATAPSKLARVVGDLLPEPRRDPAPATKRATVDEVLTARLGALRDRLHRHDARLRAGEDDAVHRMRITARRTRSALRTFAPLLDADHVDHLADELRWLGRSLAPARDAQVMRELLLDLVDEQPPELVVGAVSTRIDDELRAAERAGRERAVAALGEERYFRLLDDLDAFVASPPLTSDADSRAGEVLRALLHRDAKRLRRAVADVRAAEVPEERDGALHEARKKAKRLRYAAELAAPVLGKRARRLGRRARAVQQALGRHQDSVIVRAELRDLGVRAHLDGDNAFTYGRLHALQELEAERAEHDFERAWKRLPAKDLRRWR